MDGVSCFAVTLVGYNDGYVLGDSQQLGVMLVFLIGISHNPSL